MTTEIISILYVGDEGDDRILPALRKYDGERWHVYTASDLYDALAIYIFFCPHLTVFVGNSELTQRIFFHLASVSSPSPRLVDAMLVFGGAAPRTVPAYALVKHYPLPSNEEEVAAVILGLAEDRANAEAEIARGKFSLETDPVLRRIRNEKGNFR